MAVKISILDSPWLVFLLVWIVLAGIFWEIWTSGRYFWTNLDYWPVFLDQLGLLAGIFKVWIVLAGIFGQIWTSPISKVGWYFLVKLDYWPLHLDKFGLVLYFGWY